MSNLLDISIVIPVFNSDKNLEELITNLKLNLEKNYSSFEIILVDDCSTDSSWKIISEICHKYNFVKAILLRKNSGQHNAIFAGLRYTNGRLIITMDDDGQNSPEDIVLLTNIVNLGCDVCYANYKIKKHNFFRKFGSFLNNIVASFLFNKPFELILTSFRCFTNEIKDEILKTNSHSIYLDGIIFSITKSIKNEFVQHKRRIYGNSNYSIYKLFNLWLQMATGFSILPLRISSMLGFVFSIFSFLVALWIVFFREINSDIPLGWTSLVVIIVFFGGIQLMALGLIGEYVGRTFLTANKSPRYSEKQKLNIKHND